MAVPPSERKLQASVAGYQSWANTPDPTARTEPARRAFRDSFQEVVDPDHELDAAERARRGEAAYKAHMAKLALKSAQARRLKSTDKATAPTADRKAS